MKTIPSLTEIAKHLIKRKKYEDSYDGDDRSFWAITFLDHAIVTFENDGEERSLNYYNELLERIIKEIENL